MGSFKQYSPSYKKTVISSCPEFKEKLGHKTFRAIAYEIILYEYSTRINRGKSRDFPCSPNWLANRLNCTIRTAWGVFKKLFEDGFISIEKNKNKEVRENFLMTHKITPLKFPEFYISESSQITENSSESSLQITENISQITERFSQITESLSVNAPSSTLIPPALRALFENTNCIQLYSTNNNPPSPLFSVFQNSGCENIFAIANAIAVEQEKQKQENDFWVNFLKPNHQTKTEPEKPRQEQPKPPIMAAPAIPKLQQKIKPPLPRGEPEVNPPSQTQPVLEKPIGQMQLTLENQVVEPPQNPTDKPQTRRKITYEEEFLQWWAIYPRNDNKEKAWKKFNNALKEIPFDQLMEATKAYVALREREIEEGRNDSHRYTPHPETWLNNKRWKDDAVQTELEKCKHKSLPGIYQPESQEIKIMPKSEFDRVVKERLAKVLHPNTYKSWIENTNFEALGVDEHNDPVFKANNAFSEQYISTHFGDQIKRAFAQPVDYKRAFSQQGDYPITNLNPANNQSFQPENHATQ